MKKLKLFSFTKWIPLTVYNDACMTQYLLLARRNKKTGMISFKSKRINRITSHYNFLIDMNIGRQFDKLFEEVNE